MEVCAGTHRLVGVLHPKLLQMFLLQQKHSGHLGQLPGPLVSQFSPVMLKLFIQGPVSQDLMSNPYNIYLEGATGGSVSRTPDWLHGLMRRGTLLGNSHCCASEQEVCEEARSSAASATRHCTSPCSDKNTGFSTSPIFVLQKGEGASYLGLFLQQSLGGVAPAALGGGLHRSLLGGLQKSRAAQV